MFLAGFTLKEKPPVALTESDLSELLAALKAGEMTDTIRASLEWILQQADRSGGHRGDRRPSARAHQAGDGSGGVNGPVRRGTMAV